MCSWTNSSTGTSKTQNGEPLNEGTEGDDESEDRVVYRYDLPNELLGLYQQRHQVKAQGSSHGIRTKEKRRPQETSAKVLLPPSSVEEAAWATLTQADNHWRVSSQRLREQEQNEISHGHLDSTERPQAGSPSLYRPAIADLQRGSHGDGPRKNRWAEALEQLINQEVHSDGERESINLQEAQRGDAHAEIDVAQPILNSVKHGARTAGQLSTFQAERKFGTSGFAKGKQKHQPAERFQIINSKAPQPQVQGGAPIPLAQRLQKLVDEDSRHNVGPRQAGGATHWPSSIRVTEKLQSLIGCSSSPERYHQIIAGTKVSRHSSRLVKISKSTIQDEIVDCPDPDEDDADVQGSSRYFENPVQKSRSGRRVQKSNPAYKDEPLEDIDNHEDFFGQETSTAKSMVGVPSIATSISERFRDALLSAPPDVTSTDSFGLPARLETLLSMQKSKYLHFTKSLQTQQQIGNLGQCLDVIVLGTVDEAQLTTCRCEILRFPEEWNYQRSPQDVRPEDAENTRVIDVIFSKISSGVDVHVGCALRIHPPWQEVPRSGQSARLIFCTFFCELLH